MAQAEPTSSDTRRDVFMCQPVNVYLNIFPLTPHHPSAHLLPVMVLTPSLMGLQMTCLPS